MNSRSFDSSPPGPRKQRAKRDRRALAQDDKADHRRKETADPSARTEVLGRDDKNREVDGVAKAAPLQTADFGRAGASGTQGREAGRRTHELAPRTRRSSASTHHAERE